VSGNPGEAPIPDDPVNRLRQICRAPPGATEGISVHHPSFKVRGKTFVMYADGDGRPALWIKAPPGAQHELVASDRTVLRPAVPRPTRLVGVYLDRSDDWDGVAELVTDGYRLAAPVRLVRQLDEAA
jgi:predicted DNA-binding protein (MmcQ/YjbR family)